METTHNNGVQPPWDAGICGSPRVKCVNERQEAAAAREPHATIASPLSLARRRQRPVAVRLRQALRRAGVPAASARGRAVLCCRGPGSFGSRSLAVCAQCLQQSAAVSKRGVRPSEVCSRSVLSQCYYRQLLQTHPETDWAMYALQQCLMQRASANANVCQRSQQQLCLPHSLMQPEFVRVQTSLHAYRHFSRPPHSSAWSGTPTRPLQQGREAGAVAARRGAPASIRRA